MEYSNPYNRYGWKVTNFPIVFQRLPVFRRLFLMRTDGKKQATKSRCSRNKKRNAHFRENVSLLLPISFTFGRPWIIAMPTSDSQTHLCLIADLHQIRPRLDQGVPQP